MGLGFLSDSAHDIKSRDKINNEIKKERDKWIKDQGYLDHNH